ncbi:MAG TPA: hypothetical protein VK859_16150, partial [bacterium]|nr:hypothetical protein [bacterium]
KSDLTAKTQRRQEKQKEAELYLMDSQACFEGAWSFFSFVFLDFLGVFASWRLNRFLNLKFHLQKLPYP